MLVRVYVVYPETCKSLTRGLA